MACAKETVPAVHDERCCSTMHVACVCALMYVRNEDVCLSVDMYICDIIYSMFYAISIHLCMHTEGMPAGILQCV